MIGSPDMFGKWAPGPKKVIELKEQLSEKLKLIGLYPTGAIFEDYTGKSWYFDGSTNNFDETETSNSHLMNVQFEAIPFEQYEFKNKEDALEYAKIKILKKHIKDGLEDMSHGLAVRHFSKELIPGVEQTIKDYQEIQAMLNSAEKQTDPEQKKQIERVAYATYLQKEGGIENETARAA